MKALSWILVGFVTVLTGLAQWVKRPDDIAGTVGEAFGLLVIAFVVAGLIQAWSRKKNWNWDSFARWYFWLALGLLILSSLIPAEEERMVRQVEIGDGKFVWRCDNPNCGWEYPKKGVPKNQLPPYPDHECRQPNPVFS